LYSCVIIYLTHQFNRPIESFREALSKTATGDMNALMPVNRKDDVGELADTYNMMVFRLKNLQDDLAESERQAAWSEMARQVAHEIKNPLTPMKLSIQHLYQQVAYHQRPIEDVRNLVKRITSTLIEEIDSLSNIATDFSKFARPVTEEFRLLDINVLIESVLDLYSHDDRIDFHIDSDVHDLRIQAAHDELKRVLINLIKNAMEASGPGGLIFIRAYAHQHFAVIEVADNGKGMTEQVRTKVFVPNFSTKNSGTGLGLAISRKIIEAHKGRIHFASVVGLGTTFTVYLPLAQSGTDTGFS
ncbi:MAG: HAMP domain-containing protein, partial [Balneolales bacterium]|nr:HAMP domain-containing protein [Balneolales bacterium]